MKRIAFLLTAAVWLAGCGGGSDGITELSAEENDVTTRKVLLPLYSYPNWYDGNDSYAWYPLIAAKTADSRSRITAIINPENGHFSECNDDFARGLDDLSAAGIATIGYVYTLYGERDIAEVKEDIDNWKACYAAKGIGGIFFDEVSTDPERLAYYRQLSDYAREKGLSFVVLNPGTTTDSAYITSAIADIVVTYENPESRLHDDPPDSYNVPSDTTQLGLLLYETFSSVDTLDRFAREHHFTAFYYTADGEDGNPWDSIDKTLPQQLRLSY